MLKFWLLFVARLSVFFLVVGVQKKGAPARKIILAGTLELDLLPTIGGPVEKMPYFQMPHI